MFKKSISDQEINELPPIKFEGNIHLIERDNQIAEAVEELKKHSVIGFDTETKPNYKKGHRNKVALLQLSTEKDAYLFRLHYLTNLSPIYSILSDDKIIKVGVAVNGDFKELNSLKKFEPKNFIELQKYVKNFNIENIGLKKMTAIILNGKISKRQQRSNWQANPLSKAQLVYAATDAWASLMIYKKLKELERP